MAQTKEAVLESFRNADRHGDGTVGRDIVAGLLRGLGWQGVDIVNLVMAAPTDASDRIRYEPFVAWLFSAPPPTSPAERRYKFFVGACCDLEDGPKLDALTREFSAQWLGSCMGDVELVLFPPSAFLERARRALSREIFVGGCCDPTRGTGAVTAPMLRAVGCKWALLREPNAESVAQCLVSGLSAVLIISGRIDALLQQLATVVAGVPASAWSRIVVACEGVDDEGVYAEVRSWLRDHAGPAAAGECRIVCAGGEQNVQRHGRLAGVDGFVAGRDVQTLMALCHELVQPVEPPRRWLFVGANWKCSLEGLADVDALATQLDQRWRASAGLNGLELCVFPPHVFLERVRRRLGGSLAVGSQDAAQGLGCAGAVTAAAVRSAGCGWVLLGHSDRRNGLGETDELIAEKVASCLAQGLCVNATIGETLEAREAGRATSVLLGQLAAIATSVPAGAWSRVVIAYEPVWAIGEGASPCSPQETQRVHAALRRWLHENVGKTEAAECRLVYTGSVNEKNAESYAQLPDVDGFVVGRAGLDVDKLVSICGTLVRCKASSGL